MNLLLSFQGWLSLLAVLACAGVALTYARSFHTLPDRSQRQCREKGALLAVCFIYFQNSAARLEMFDGSAVGKGWNKADRCPHFRNYDKCQHQCQKVWSFSSRKGLSTEAHTGQMVLCTGDSTVHELHGFDMDFLLDQAVLWTLKAIVTSQSHHDLQFVVDGEGHLASIGIPHTSHPIPPLHFYPISQSA